jgi:hypothetical protein
MITGLDEAGRVEQVAERGVGGTDPDESSLVSRNEMPSTLTAATAPRQRRAAYAPARRPARRIAPCQASWRGRLRGVVLCGF